MVAVCSAAANVNVTDQREYTDDCRNKSKRRSSNDERAVVVRGAALVCVMSWVAIGPGEEAKKNKKSK